MHHYISNSPWSGPKVIKQARTEIVWHPHFEVGSMLLGDESSEDRNGGVLVGGGRQYIGRLGKVDFGQTGVFLSIIKDCKHNWIDGELFLLEDWFDDDHKELRQKTGVPDERKFQTKIELFWQMLQRAQAEGVPFDAVACDGLYGRSFELRQKMDQAGIEFYADVPANTQVYLSEPKIGIPLNKRGRKAKKQTVLSPQPYFDNVTLGPRVVLDARFARTSTVIQMMNNKRSSLQGREGR